jgi:hypothetical protein
MERLLIVAYRLRNERGLLPQVVGGSSQQAEEVAAIRRKAFARKLAEEEFEKPMHEKETCWPGREDGERDSRQEARADRDRACLPEWFQRKRLKVEQAVHTRRKIAVAGAERSVEKRETWSSTHSRHSQERYGERERPLGISADGFIVRSPLRELCPIPFEQSESLKKRDGTRNKQE